MLKLIKDSLNPKSRYSSKRVSLIISQFLFGLQIFLDIIVHVIILLFVTPKPDVEFYRIMATVQITGLSLNAITIWWNLGAIKSVDVAFSKLMEFRFKNLLPKNHNQSYSQYPTYGNMPYTDNPLTNNTENENTDESSKGL